MINIAISFLISAIVTFLIIKVTIKFDWVYKPQANRWNTRIVSLHGGVGFGISLILLSILGLIPFSQDILFIVIASLFMLMVGLIDDIRHLNPKPKFIINIIISILAVFFGYKFSIFNNIIADSLLTFFWIIGITNAINMLDNMDGATTGIVTISMLSLLLVGHNLSADITSMVQVLTGILLGFLVFNFNPAKIFMGDSGSLFLGTIASLLLIKYHQSIDYTDTFMLLPLSLVLPALFIIVPIIDTTFVTTNRKLNGYPASLGDKGHTTHRLSYIFKNDKISVTILYFYQLTITTIVYFKAYNLLYPLLIFTIIALLYLTKKTNHMVWPDKFR